MSFFSTLMMLGIGLSGAIGAVTRYLLGRFFVDRWGTRFPFGTLFINITGAFLIGIIFALTTHKLLTPVLQSMLATGFLGGYTTFSTFCWESSQLVRGGNRRLSIVYLSTTLALGLLAALAGLGLGGVL